MPTMAGVAPALCRKRVSTDAVPQSERFAYWLDMVCSIYVRLECEKTDDRVVFGDIEFTRLGALDFTELSSNARLIRRTTSLIRTSSDDDYCLVQVQRQGQGVVIQDGRTAIVEPGDFVVYDCTRPYELRFDEAGHKVVVLRVPRPALEPHVGNLSELTATRVNGAGAAGQLLLSMVETLRRDIDQLHPASANGVSEAITSIIAAGLRGLPGAQVRKTSCLANFHIERVKAFVRDNLRDPSLSIASVAAAMRMSPDHLSKIFRPEPVQLSKLIWQWRINACKRELGDPRYAHLSVSEIAFSWGFNDAAHFSRSFKELCGKTPREWRQHSLQEILVRAE